MYGNGREVKWLPPTLVAGAMALAGMAVVDKVEVTVWMVMTTVIAWTSGAGYGLDYAMKAMEERE